MTNDSLAAKTTMKMTNILSTDAKRALWGDGPWLREFDRVEWKTEAGLDGLIHRHDTGGHLCGYVAVPPGHPLHGQNYDAPDVEVHGGLTYADACQGHICHVPAPGEPDDVWWFGFDCAHGGRDMSPSTAKFFREQYGDRVPPAGPYSGPYGGTYRTVEYVRVQCEKLAAQLAAEVIAP